MGNLPSTATRTLILCLLLGIAARFYGFFDPWGEKDHLNRAGVMTHELVLCLKTVPLKESLGRASHNCPALRDISHNPFFDSLSESEKNAVIQKAEAAWPKITQTLEPLVYYSHHPSTFVYSAWTMTKLFGDSESSVRFSTLIFSILNIFMVYLIGRKIWGPFGSEPLVAATLQSCFLGTMYFSTHADIPSEANVFFLLLATYFTFRKKWVWAFLSVGLSTLYDWPALFAVIPLAIFMRQDQISKSKIMFGILCVGLWTFAVAMWVRGLENPILFFIEKIRISGHVSTPKSFAEHIYFLSIVFKSFVRYHSRLLGPLFAGLSIWGLTRVQMYTPLAKAVFMIGLPALITFILGREYVVVHIFWYMLWIPVWSWVVAEVLSSKWFDEKFSFVLTFFILFFTALYPFGVYQSNRTHDIVNSTAYVLIALAALSPLRKMLSPLIFIAMMALTNVSQLINYKNDPFTAYNQCKKDFEDFRRTGEPVHRVGPPTDQEKNYYCRGIPIIWENQN